MSELEEKLNSILSDPEAMAQVMNLAQSLSAQAGGAAQIRMDRRTRTHNNFFIIISEMLTFP